MYKVKSPSPAVIVLAFCALVLAHQNCIVSGYYEPQSQYSVYGADSNINDAATYNNHQDQFHQNEPQQQQQHSSLFGSLLSPFRSTYQHLFGGSQGINNNLNHLQNLQAKTFKMFMQLYNKTYLPNEIPRRMRLFLQRRKQIEDSVRAYTSGRLSFMMRENSYIDWDEHELKALAGVAPPRSLQELTPEEHSVIFSGNQQPVLIDHRDYYVIDTKSANNVEPSVSRSLDNATLAEEEETTTLIDISETTKATRTNSSDDDDAPNLSVGAPVSIPARMDWRRSGCVAAPVNQHKCGCCYALATMNVLESMRCINQVSSPILSPQQVVDCSTPRAGYQNFGCNGGWPTRVLRYLQDVGVAAREACYPLILRQEVCKLNRVRQAAGCTVQASAKDSGRLRYKVLNNERDILYHVAKTGPVVTVMKTTDKFLYYGSGIFDDPSCSRRADDVDHAISIVGYGRENGVDYWLIKNSWGAEWGLDGYGKFRRGSNACSIGHWGWVILE